MSDRVLGIFPLPIVLFPGAPQLLHIFEPRYRQLLDDCLAGDRRFGLAYVDPSAAVDPAPAVGVVGCSAHVQTAQRLADGRSNILCAGEQRFVLREYVRTDRLYRVARVDYFDDDPDETDSVKALAQEVGRTFKDVAAGMRALRGEIGEPGRLPTGPTELSLLVASALDLDPGQKQELLTSRSTTVRLHRVLDHLHQLQIELTQQVERSLAQRRNGQRPRSQAAQNS